MGTNVFQVLHTVKMKFVKVKTKIGPALSSSITTSATLKAISSYVPRLAATITPIAIGTTSILPITAYPSTSKSRTATTATEAPRATEGLLLVIDQRRTIRSCHINCFGFAVITEVCKELDGLALRDGAEIVGFDRGLVDEEVLASVVRGDEALALDVVEPPHLPGRSLIRHGKGLRF
ncbi:hypothetical protein C1H46_011192 [Malus baccata]|uniref:Uncharacterized protein n=1 Tax=Malus baccata TaxID=106549 RepID=A0A540MWQ2_MALBA|nr:hypothetical protein C1H46_011192 [Malus baccata]